MKSEPHIKFCHYWMDMMNTVGMTDEEVGIMVRLIFKFHIYGDEGEAKRLSDKCLSVWAVIKKDLEYQKKHKRAWRFPVDDSKTIRNSGEYSEWRRNVFERDNYTCKACGLKGGVINAHHIKHFSKFPKLRLDLNNGITLCKKCHRKVHRGEIICPTVS